MENNEIMERLLQDDKQNNSAVKESADTNAPKNWELQVSRIRIVSAKYKVYIVLLAIFICLLALVYIPQEDKALKANSSSFDQVNSQLNRLKTDIKSADNDKKYLCDETDGIISNEQALKNCLDNQSVCSSLPETWKIWSWNKLEDYDTKVRLSYLQTNSLYNEKMPVDEKRVLKNLNEYLIKQDISWGDRKKVWDILKINIWDPESVEGWANHFFKVSVDVEIEFDTVGDLTWFLYNVEKKMIDNREDRILYKIQSVSYDVVSNDEPQITDISMIAYYYHDERFDEQSECGNDPDKTNVGDNQQDDNISDSDWFLQKIFKNF